jgi:hypothetical protein
MQGNLVISLPEVGFTDTPPKRSALQMLERVNTNMNQGTERLASQGRIVAVGLLTRGDMTMLGPTFDRAWPVEECPSFSELLRAIDDADRRLSRDAPAPD